MPSEQQPARSELSGWSFLKSPRWIGYYVLIIVFSIVCVLLGNWQFDRRAEAQAEIARIDNNYDADIVPLEVALPSLNSFDLDGNKWQPVELTGTYLGEPYLARNRPGQDGVGSLLIHPILLTSGDVFFVDRGWVNVNASDGVPSALPMPAEGEVTVTVRLREGEKQLDGRESVGRTVASIHLPELEGFLERNAYTGAYGQLISESPAAETGILPPRPERDEGPHLSYALQWYVFILIVLGGAWYAARLEYRSINADSESVKQAEAKKIARKRRRGPSDAEEEDALLDAG